MKKIGKQLQILATCILGTRDDESLKQHKNLQNHQKSLIFAIFRFTSQSSCVMLNATRGEVQVWQLLNKKIIDLELHMHMRSFIDGIKKRNNPDVHEL